MKEESNAEAPGSPDGKANSREGSVEKSLNTAEGELSEKMDDDGTVEEEKKENGSSSLPRELHRTASIFLRNLAPTITKLEVEAVRLFSIGFSIFFYIFWFVE